MTKKEVVVAMVKTEENIKISLSFDYVYLQPSAGGLKFF